MKLIESKTLATAAASIEFTSIPQDGTDLVALVSSRSTVASIVAAVEIKPNGAAGTFRRLWGEGSGGVYTDSLSAMIGFQSAASNTADTFGNISFYIPNYTATQNKSISIDSVSEGNSSQIYMLLGAGLSSNTAAVTSLTFVSSENFVAGSTISLYKITKGSDGIVTTS
jgi:hypothetical protein